MSSSSQPVIYTARMREFDAWFSDDDEAVRKSRYQQACLTADSNDAEFISNATQVVSGVDPAGQYFDAALVDHLQTHWLEGAESWFNDPNARKVLSKAYERIFQIGAETGLRLSTIIKPEDVDEVSVDVVRGAGAMLVAISIPRANVPMAATPPIQPNTFIVTGQALWHEAQPAVLHFTAETADHDVPAEFAD